MPATVTFDALQRRLVERLHDTVLIRGPGSVVACPSTTFAESELRKISGIQFYEERMLYLVLLLRDPALELIYPTSVPIDEAIVDYYLSWLPDPAGARARLHLFSVEDPAPSALTDKLLARPDVVVAMRRAVRDPDRSFILPFNVTAAEARLAEAMSLPVYGTHPALSDLGSKSGARRVALEAGVDVFVGEGDLYSIAAMERAIERIRVLRPNADAVVAKLNNGFSGQGNLVLEVAGLQTPLESSTAMFCASEESWATYAGKVGREGAIVEELVRVPGTTSPSVQVQILPSGRCEVVSTHDQILGGPDGQVYLGCTFPARPDYRGRIQDDALRVARVLADHGAIGSFGIDFVVVPGRGVVLSEINLRLGGTTHPFLMTRYLTGGAYAADSGELLVDGAPRVYKASDNVKSRRYAHLSPRQVIAAVDAAGLAYDQGSKTGATLHLLGALPVHGKFGLVCIAASQEQAGQLFDQVRACVDALADSPDNPGGPGR